MVGHCVMGVPFSSIKLNNLSRKGLRSGCSSISYIRERLSELREDVCGVETGLAGGRCQEGLAMPSRG